jgi:hypothetical protein
MEREETHVEFAPAFVVVIVAIVDAFRLFFSAATVAP